MPEPEEPKQPPPQDEPLPILEPDPGVVEFRHREPPEPPKRPNSPEHKR